MDSLVALAPVAEDYATLPIDRAFDWSGVGEALPSDECYLVAFRSIRRRGADEVRLAHYDELAHQEASRSPGFIHYFKGPTMDDGSCLSFCLWTGRPEARTAAGGRAHVEAVGLLGEMYEDYRLEFVRVRRDRRGLLAFEPYDLA